MHPLGRAFRQTIHTFGSQRKLWLPFLVTAFVEVLGILVLWLAPHPPFSKLLAPPVRYFFTDRVLHYPWHLWFLYYAMKHTHIAVSIGLGAFMSGIACAMVRQTHEGVPLSVRGALVSRQVKYGRVLLVWLITWGLAEGLVTGLVRFAPKAAWVFWAAIGLTILLQLLLVNAIPASVFERSPWWKALFQSVREAARYPISTFVVVAIPSAAMIAFAFFVSPVRVSEWMLKTAPEIVVPLVALRLFVWTLTDALMTITVAHLWWLHRQPQLASASVGATATARARALPSTAMEKNHAVA